MTLAERIENAVEDWTFAKYAERLASRGRAATQRRDWWAPDWSEYLYSVAGTEFQIPGLELPLISVGCWIPAGEEYGDFSGPQYMIFTYDGRFFAKAGRNLSHVGAEFEGQFYEVKAEQVTVDSWTRLDDTELDGELTNPEAGF